MDVIRILLECLLRMPCQPGTTEKKSIKLNFRYDIDPLF
jgi:hypothetical protein